jgi:POT family proton-dependent oligopeptide transporter
MGLWFLASAFGQLVAGKLGASFAKIPKGAGLEAKLIKYTDGYLELANYALIAGVVLILITPLIKKLMGEIK